MSNAVPLQGTNIVILARNYNPSIVSKEWLYEKNIVREPVGNFVHTPVFSLIETDRISFVLSEDRLQISLRSITPENVEALPRLATEFVSCLPETPYVAVGFNYNYRVPKASSQLEMLFSPNEVKLKELFSEDYEIGEQVFFRFKEFIVGMTAAPVRGEMALAMNFNFHSDAPGAEQVKQRLELYAQTKEKAEEILKGVSR
ncbi:MAG: hypothetical protein ACE5IE_02870 [Dehalococcoidia bacterium]